jgi:hypothetical protein
VLPGERERAGVRLADQRRRLEQYVANHGWELAEVLEDVGAAARPRNQPALKRQVWSDGWRPENLRKPGLSPATLIDVGVAMGTPALYRAFPDAHLVLIEPLAEYEQDLARLVRETGGEYPLNRRRRARGHRDDRRRSPQPDTELDPRARRAPG